MDNSATIRTEESKYGMDINTEINKVFGNEMAKLFAGTISEEQLKATAEKIWIEMNKSERDTWGKRRDSEIERRIKEKIMDRLYDKIKAILDEPVNEELLEKHAREMVAKAREAGEEIIIRDMAKNYASNILSVYMRDEEVVNKVLCELHVESENGRRY